MKNINLLIYMGCELADPGLLWQSADLPASHVRFSTKPIENEITFSTELRALTRK